MESRERTKKMIKPDMDGVIGFEGRTKKRLNVWDMIGVKQGSKNGRKIKKGTGDGPKNGSTGR